MKIRVKNLGALKQAEFSLGELTIICGGNNTGKTYATYALFGFLISWRRLFLIKINNEKIEQLLSDGVVRLDIKEYAERANQIIIEGCNVYTQELSDIFASQADRFKSTEFNVILETLDIPLKSKVDRKIGSGASRLFSITKDEASSELVVTLLVENKEIKISSELIAAIIANTVKEVIFAQFLPRPFIASAERTGAAIFRKELNFPRNRLLDDLGQVDKNFDPKELLFKDYQDYALPIKANVQFTRQLESIVKKDSFIAKEHPDILDSFANIIGGNYTVTKNDELYYIPKRNKNIKLSMDESSSAVRSLLDIGFYLKHEAQHGDLLMIDEPELNLHPENQRRVARLISRLVNIGIKVFITTHSDYIIKELNTLIMLNHDKPHLKQIAEEEKYQPEELISSDKIKVYIAEERLIKLDGKTKRTPCQTLTLADIDPEMGINAYSFDTAIETMNRIQSAIVWSED